MHANPSIYAYHIMREGVHVVQAHAEVSLVLLHPPASIVWVQPQLDPTFEMCNLWVYVCVSLCGYVMRLCFIFRIVVVAF